MCLVEEASKTTEVGPAWLRAIGQVLAWTEAPTSCPGITGSGDRARGGNPRAQSAMCLGVAENWALEKALRRQKGCHPRYPPEPLLHSAFGLVNPDQPRFVPVGSVGHLGVAWAPWGRFLRLGGRGRSVSRFAGLGWGCGSG